MFLSLKIKYTIAEVSIVMLLSTPLCPFSKSKFNLYEALSLTMSTLLHRLVLSIDLDTVQTGTGKVDPATAAHASHLPDFFL